MLNTHVRPVRELRNNYAELAKLVKERDHIIITNNGRGEAVLIGIDEYAEYEAYLHRRYVMEELKKAQLEAGNPNAVWFDHDQVWNALCPNAERM